MSAKKKRTGGVRNVIKLAEDLESRGLEATFDNIIRNAFAHKFGGRLGGYSNISPSDVSQYFRYKEGKLSLDDDAEDDLSEDIDE